MKVLMVEDLVDLVSVLGDMLSKLGYEFTGITKAEEALKLLNSSSEKFDIYIFDLNLNHMSITGLDLTKIVREKHPDATIIIESGTIEYIPQLTHYNVDKVFVKPFSMKEAKNYFAELLVRKS